MENGNEASRMAISKDEPRRGILRDGHPAILRRFTMTFARKRIKVYNSSSHAWMSFLNEWKRLENPLSWFSATAEYHYNVKIVGLLK